MLHVSFPSGVWGEAQPRSNLVHFSFKICHLVAGYAVGLQYAVKNIGMTRCVVISLPYQSHSRKGNCPLGSRAYTHLHCQLTSIERQRHNRNCLTSIIARSHCWGILSCRML